MSTHASARVSPPGLHRFLRYYYLARFWYDFIFAYAVYTLYFSLRGMSVFDISLLLTWWSLTAMVFEVPSGALADCWSRRKLLALSPLVKALCFVTWSFAGHNFYLFALGFLLWSLGSSLRSGTSEALLYDTLVHYGRKDDYARVQGRTGLYYHVGLALSTITGGLLASYRLEWAILLSVVPLFLSAFCAFRLEEAPKVGAAETAHYFGHFRLALQELRHNRVLLYLVIYLWGISVFGALEEFEQLYYRLAGLPIAAFGIATTAVSALQALGFASAYRFSRSAFVIYGLPFASAVLLVFVARYPGLPAIAAYLVAYALTTPAIVLVNSRLQHAMTGPSRATVTSAVALLLEVPAYSLACGIIGRLWGVPTIYLSGALLLFPFATWGFAVRRRLRAVESHSSLPGRS